MNFSDFGVKDESELEQDEFSLSRPTFGKDNQLTVIGWKGMYKYNKYYIVKCSECLKDPELFGDGIFRIKKENFNLNLMPCGCASNPRWLDHQYRILVGRKCKERGYIFHGFAEDFKKQNTKLRLECQKHGVWTTTCLNSLLNKNVSCPKCSHDNLGKRSIKDYSYHFNNFMATGKFKEGTKFWRSERLNSQGAKVYWYYTCPVCSNDEYVKDGVCSGVFEATRSDLTNGVVPCRCSPSYYWTKEQYEYRIKKRMQESKTTDEFVGFIEEFKSVKSYFTRECKIHGGYETSINNYLSHSHSCPLCANRTQQECYINFIKDNENTIALKFGIAKDSEVRVKQHDYKSIFSVEQYGVWYFQDVTSCKAAEKFIKQNLKCKILTKQEMPYGYTETTSVENLEAIIKIYEDFGGVKKIIESENLLEDKSL